MHLMHVAERRYAQFESLRHQPGLKHAFSTRPLDVSARRDEQAPLRAERRALMAGDLGLDPARIAYCVQVHETKLAVVSNGRSSGPLEGCDAAICNQPGVALMTFSADCPLILVYDPEAPAIGVAHASWRCTVAGIAARLVEAMQREFGCRAARMIAGIGPSAGPERYEVGEDVYAAAEKLPRRDELFPRSNGRMCFDLWLANRAQLAEAGIPEGRIEAACICTMTRTDLFYSYRREGAGCGHFGLMAALDVSRAGDKGK